MQEVDMVEVLEEFVKAWPDNLQIYYFAEQRHVSIVRPRSDQIEVQLPAAVLDAQKFVAAFYSDRYSESRQQTQQASYFSYLSFVKKRKRAISHSHVYVVSSGAGRESSIILGGLRFAFGGKSAVGEGIATLLCEEDMTGEATLKCTKPNMLRRIKVFRMMQRELKHSAYILLAVGCVVFGWVLFVFLLLALRNLCYAILWYAATHILSTFFASVRIQNLSVAILFRILCCSYTFEVVSWLAFDVSATGVASLFTCIAFVLCHTQNYAQHAPQPAEQRSVHEATQNASQDVSQNELQLRSQHTVDSTTSHSSQQPASQGVERYTSQRAISEPPPPLRTLSSQQTVLQVDTARQGISHAASKRTPNSATVVSELIQLHDWYLHVQEEVARSGIERHARLVPPPPDWIRSSGFKWRPVQSDRWMLQRPIDRRHSLMVKESFVDR
eukprot:g3819.t1